MIRAPNGKASLRCAIYTRKSSEEGLDQDFNSLHAQREACEAFIMSQRHEGWQVIKAHYDDGGLSGGHMDRPALQRLLDDIKAGKIDVVVVYKIDRLTRSLTDFARMVEIFDAQSVSFVSVTQQFNTTTSMGRLTLNVLLSFAQFEREVTGERIRDKIAASKKKGIWMGGPLPLGYDVKDRKLVINGKEAATVRHIFDRYADLGSVGLLGQELEDEGIVSKIRINRHGHKTGGQPIARGALYRMLSNRIYLGEIVHKDESYAGEHQAIIPEDLWTRVQALLAANRIKRRIGSRARHPSLLSGLIFDEDGKRLTPSHARKAGRHYRYYVSASSARRTRSEGKIPRQSKGWRLPAGDIEVLVNAEMIRLLGDAPQLHTLLEPHASDAIERHALMTSAKDTADEWSGLTIQARRQILLKIIDRIVVRTGAVDLTLRPDRLAGLLKGENRTDIIDDLSDTPVPRFTTTIEARLKRAGLETSLVGEGGTKGGKAMANDALVQLIARAQDYQSIFLRGGKSIAEMAEEVGVGSSYFTRLVRLSFLAPDIVKAIANGQQPSELTARRLVANTRLPVHWADQRSMLGFD